MAQQIHDAVASIAGAPSVPIRVLTQIFGFGALAQRQSVDRRREISAVRHAHDAIHPPSTIRLCPLMNRASFDDSHATADATSPGVPRRGIGVRDRE